MAGEIRSGDFGLLIAYLAPGYVALWCSRPLSPTLAGWVSSDTSEASVGDFLFATVAAVVAGLMASTVRWAILDQVHHLTGVRQPQLDFSRLFDRVDAFSRLVEDQYRYYQFYGNTLVTLLWGYGVHLYLAWFGAASLDGREVLLLPAAVLLFAGSRNTLRTYYCRIEQLLGEEAPSRLIVS